MRRSQKRLQSLMSKFLQRLSHYLVTLYQQALQLSNWLSALHWESVVLFWTGGSIIINAKHLPNDLDCRKANSYIGKRTSQKRQPPSGQLSTRGWVLFQGILTYNCFQSADFLSRGFILCNKDILTDYKSYISLDLYEVLLRRQWIS